MTSLHLRIPLLKEQGVELIPGSHKCWDTPLQRNVRLELNGHKHHESLPNAELIPLNVGDVLIFSAQMLHRGDYELNKARNALDLCIGKLNPFTLNFLDRKLMHTPDELELINSKQWFILNTK